MHALYPLAQEIFGWAWSVGAEETFSGLWWDDFLLAMSKVACCSLHQLALELYSRLVLKRGLKVRSSVTDGENNKVLDRAMEYTRVVGVELADMLVSVNLRLLAVEPRVPVQHMFGGDGLQNYICDHQDCLEQLEDQLGNLMTMTEYMI